MSDSSIKEEDTILGNLLFSINKKLIIIPFFLLFIGVFTLFSLSSNFDLIKHIFYVLLSVFSFFIIIFFPKDILKKFLNFSLFIIIFLLLLTYIQNEEINGAVRWLKLGSFSIQPSELAKGPFICFISWFFYLSLKKIDYRFLYFPLSTFFIIIFFLVLQPDIGTSLYFLISFILTVALYIRKIKLFIIGFIIIFIFIFFAYILNEYVRFRFDSFLFETSRQVNLSLSAINEGGFVGVGLGEGQLKYIIPESQNDFIFSIIIEEVGIFFGILLVFLFPCYLYISKKSSEHLDNLFLRNTVFILSFMTCFQAYVNISTALDLIPPTGMPLPFVSSGGSSLLSYSIIFGTVSNFTRYEKSTPNTS